MTHDPPGGLTRSAPRDRFITRVAIVAAAAGLLFLAWEIRHALILVFAGIVAAVIFSAIADPLRRWTGMSRTLAVLGSGAIIAAVLGVFGWIAMPAVQSQGQELIAQMPGSLEELDRMMGSWLPEEAMRNGGIMGDLARRLAAWSGTALAAVTTFVLVVAAGIFFALHPRSYRDGLVSLIAPARQDRLREALDRTGDALKGWLRAQLISMAVVGVGVAGATWALGLASPIALGLIAGLLEFVPIIGPIAAAVPALLLAMAISPSMVLWTGLTYFAIEQLELNVILPLAQREVAELPPAILIFAFVAMGAVFGMPGVIVSAPLSVALYTLVNDLYVEPLNRRDD